MRPVENLAADGVRRSISCCSHLRRAQPVMIIGRLVRCSLSSACRLAELDVRHVHAARWRAPHLRVLAPEQRDQDGDDVEPHGLTKRRLRVE